MIDSIKNILRQTFKKNSPKTTYTRESFQRDFWANHHNAWLKNDRYVERNLRELFTLLDSDALNYFQSRPLVLVPSTGELSCALSGLWGLDVIIVFPDLIRMLRSAAPRRGLAILAHELGHLIGQHGERIIDRLAAQVEADMYAVKLGLGQELQDILSAFDDIDCRVRISYLTSAMSDELLKSTDAFH
jgi:hypothetical protein